MVEKHEFVIVVGPSHAAAAKAGEAETLAALARRFEEAQIGISVIDIDLVDGDYMLVPCRGSIGAEGSILKPQPPEALYRAIEAALDEMRFLQPPTMH